MRDSTLSPDTADISSWSARCRYWIAESETKVSRRSRERESNPLILNGHGLSIRVHRGTLVIRGGNTHYPAEEREWRYFKGSLDIPLVIIAIDGSGEITLDALDWMAEQGTSLIRLRWDGQFISVVTAGGQAASYKKIWWQERTRKDPAGRIRFATNQIRDKAHNTVATMEGYLPRSKQREQAYDYVSRKVEGLEYRAPRSMKELLGFEGSIANAYFRAWSAIDIKWRIAKKYPIPDAWKRFRTRAAERENSYRNYRATHPVNAMLNYAYGVVLARTQIQVIADGYDPNIGILHDRKHSPDTRPAFVLDKMEPFRPVADRAVLKLLANETFSGADFSIQYDGNCRLNPELAQRVAQLTAEEYGKARPS